MLKTASGRPHTSAGSKYPIRIGTACSRKPKKDLPRHGRIPPGTERPLAFRALRRGRDARQHPDLIGIYKIASDPTDMNPGELQLYVNDGFSDWNAQPGGTVYVSVISGKVSVSACTLSFISDAFGYKT